MKVHFIHIFTFSLRPFSGNVSGMTNVMIKKFRAQMPAPMRSGKRDPNLDAKTPPAGMPAHFGGKRKAGKYIRGGQTQIPSEATGEEIAGITCMYCPVLGIAEAASAGI